MNKNYWNIHPGEILKEEFMTPLHLNSHQLAHLLGVPAPRINDIILQKRGISADTALRLAKFFGTTPRFWMNLQTSYEIKKTEDDMEDILPSIPIFNHHNASLSLKDL